MENETTRISRTVATVGDMTPSEHKEWKAWKDEVVFLLKNNGFSLKWIWDATTKENAPRTIGAFCRGLTPDDFADLVVMGDEVVR